MAGPMSDSVLQVECWLKTPAITSGTHMLTHHHAHIYTIHTCTHTQRQNQTPLHSGLVSAVVPASLTSLEEGTERGTCCVAVALGLLPLVASQPLSADGRRWSPVSHDDLNTAIAWLCLTSPVSAPSPARSPPQIL